MLIHHICGSYSREIMPRHSPLVPPSLQFAQISLLLLVHPLQLGQADTVLHFHCVQHVHRHFTVQLKGTGRRKKKKRALFSQCHVFHLWVIIIICLYPTGSSFLCLQLYFLPGSSVLGRSMRDCFLMASSKICLLTSRRQSRPSSVISGQEAERIETREEFTIRNLELTSSFPPLIAHLRPC